MASPRNNDYNGDFSEKSVIIHAINYFKNESEQEHVSRIFFNINTSYKKRLVESFLIKSPIFCQVQDMTSIDKIIKVKDEWISDVLTMNAEEVYIKSIMPKNTEKPSIVLNQNKYYTAGRDIKDQSSLSNDFSSNKMNAMMKSDKSQYPGLVKISHWIISNIVQIIIGLIIGYLIFRFGWN